MKKLFSVLLCCSIVIGSEAVIVAGGDGAQNTNAPTGGQGWDYVGRITSANGAPSGVIYISNNWFITAYHIKALDNPTGVLFGGAAYAIDPNSWTRLINSSNGDADLIMFRVVGDVVPLSGLTVRSSNLSNNAALTMIGNGRNREPDETQWNVLWVEDGIPTVYSGYKWASGATKRWGTNKKNATGAGLVDDGYGITDVFRTDFDDIGGDEAQGAIYDSGGGVFYNNGGDWELAGIMITVQPESGQPWPGTSVYGNETLIAYMKYYAAQISSTALIDDIDEDGIPDEWEYDQTGSTIGVVAATDQDADGFTGEEEWIADTDPTLGTSFLKLSAYTNASSLVFESSTDRNYLVEYCANLTNQSWQADVAGWIAGSESQIVHNVSVAESNRFYRVRVKLP